MVLSLQSTVGFEALGFGKKVLICNFTELMRFNYPLPVECFINVEDYDIFENKMTALLDMDEEEYLSRNKNWFSYYMKYRQDPPQVIIRKSILKTLQM